MARKAHIVGPIKPWAITWVLTILAARSEVLALPDMPGNGVPLWVPLGLETLRFMAIGLVAHVAVHILFGAWGLFTGSREI